MVLDLADQPPYEDVIETCAIGAMRWRVYVVYVPNGREPDHEHYAYKPSWLTALKAARLSWRPIPCRTP